MKEFLQIRRLHLFGDLERMEAGATQAVTLDISKTFDKVWHAGLLHKVKSWNFGSNIWPYFVISQ